MAPAPDALAIVITIDSRDPLLENLDDILTELGDSVLVDQAEHGEGTVLHLPEIWNCDAHVQIGIDPDDGYPVIGLCGARAWRVGEGWECAAGHQHFGIEAELAPWGPEWEREQEERNPWEW